MYPSKNAQIAYLKADKDLTEVSSKYTDYVDVFLSKLVIEHPKYTNINNQAIELVNDQQSLYGSNTT